ncbi:(2Fe-2S)-binding protein [Microvirga guangxiensis]|uniref:2Fe-2S iron-sulfur cluster binding domain-containing protein n=1 Tax=Microvirga guangxiensis TaxID=549386 RepID=A0A1G5BQG8_9HYPH|nr:(2Fe-2S)-binding protein [Microvirga guangxiensis]SCX92465.1 2Fe-2S iron-sulfur cluster binding domain-containing protein [Microvirga guangxiensis]
MALLKRLARHELPPISFTLNGTVCTGRVGDTVLTAILTQADQLRLSDFSGSPRAGFCQMGACQDCWVMTSDGERIRACSTALEPGMNLRTFAEQRS